MPIQTCPEGHSFFKTSNCPTCPKCEQLNKPKTGFHSLVSAPARRALENAGIETPEQLASWSTEELLKLHGIGKTAIPVLEEYLKNHHLQFKTPHD